MHEASIAAGIIERLETHPELAGKRILSVRLRVGRLTTVVPDNLRFLFGAVAEGTCCADAALEIEEVPAHATCERCGRGFEIEEPVFLGPGCGSGDIRVDSGRELTIETVEAE